ncbi:MAG: hypothetical protein F6J95_020655 [Leptolyngbya sp. SIO1E4]|nr:hypothetical protein [Leptolyngbya sp. SIO1E4]
MNNLHSDILDSLTEYDLADIVDALCQLHNPTEVVTLLQTNGRQAPSNSSGHQHLLEVRDANQPR